MPSENELRTMLADVPLPKLDIDTGSVIRRSRRRRLPRQIGVGSAMTLAVIGIGVAGFTRLQPSPVGMMAETASDSSGAGEWAPTFSGGGTTGLAPIEKLNGCGGPLAEVTPNEAGLVLEPQFEASVAAGTQQVAGTVTLLNTGTQQVRGTTAASPTMTLSQDGVTVWHSNGPTIMLAALVDLAPGASREYDATITPVLCGEEDETQEQFRAELPPLEPGEYQLSAAILLTPEDGSAGQLVTGPAQAITIE
ncbi:hypothetical protein FB562_1629 [Homoserinimonas aerilata]|uniref:Intracellular proteinase inhibitor BsuPI n=1 Tax=Homoserinimonas aerilata TaxID=1162970 RepID=A0A542YKT4_9MICO|nr:hypothetical protein [Homoserinimonas aerilata]TQL48534.1 hypothetical protein FB562_1629 [Homoserinimonas aerilata]